MLGRQAKTLSAAMVGRAMARARLSAWPERDQTIVLLSVYAGLRAGEIAKLRWGMVLRADGRIADLLSLEAAISKYSSGRRIPLHRELRPALAALRRSLSPQCAAWDQPVILSLRGGPMRANSIVNWFTTLYREVGLEGCSSHSGRRTFVTTAARKAHKAGASLRDVQLLAGHRSIETTQRYIDGDSEAQRKLIRLL